MAKDPGRRSRSRSVDWRAVLAWALIVFGAGNSLVGLAVLLGGSARGLAPVLAGVLVGLIGFGAREDDPGFANRPQLRGLVIALFAAWLAAFVFIG